MEQKKELTAKINFKINDVWRFNLSVAMKNIVNVITMVIGLGVFVLFFYRMFTSEVSIDVFISKNVMLLIIPILIFALIPWRVWQITLHQMQMPAFAEGVTYTFENEGVTLDTGEAREQVKWDIFASVVETKNDFRFYVNAISAQIIPKHNLSIEQQQLLKEIIKEAMPSNKCCFK